MRATSIATVCLSGALDQKIDAIARAGFDGIELFEPDLIASYSSPEEIARRVADAGLRIDLYQPIRDVEATTPDAFARALRRAKSKFDVMRQLGVDTALLCSNVATAATDDDDVMAEQLYELAQAAADSGVRVAYEALAWGRHVSTYDHAWRIVESVDHPALGVCLDSFHILARGSDLDGIARIPGEKIFYLQLADAPRMNLDPLSWSRHHRLFPGEGDWDLVDFTGRVLDAGYSGPLSLEVFNDVFRQSQPVLTARDAWRSLARLDMQLDARTATSAPNPAVRGVSFAELQPGDVGQLELLLKMLGFARRGVHRRKDLSLWVQNEARVVVNRSLLGATTRIAAIGLDVADAEVVHRRAAALRIPRAPRDRASDEAPLDGYVAPDETIVFADGDVAGWLGEFEHPAPVEPVGITRIDHVSLVMPWQRAAEAQLFFSSLLELRRSASVDVSSDRGLMSSTALTPAAPGPGVIINVPPAPGMESMFVNHLAFTCTDIHSTLEILRARNIRTLSVPDNYYDDLLARGDLSEKAVARLRALDLLYDRDDDGEFFHAYLPAMDGVEFELVQRTHGHRGYGAVNAPVRLAALRAEASPHRYAWREGVRAAN
ncbi:TIM barrel protein [Microbacterium sp. NPDC078428]|uniref:sugar phosphate isomerase/epimerase and 4-hydroxyphenylpyruvate domain-containing protein n=1 Tax=Microbacterium sp. NPDC078428 TaxID=3364190 RepID=UPI0037CC6D58